MLLGQCTQVLTVHVLSIPIINTVLYICKGNLTFKQDRNMNTVQFVITKIQLKSHQTSIKSCFLFLQRSILPYLVKFGSTIFWIWPKILSSGKSDRYHAM